MQTWDELLATAVVGTEQRELQLAARDDDLGQLLAQTNNADREGSLLTAAAVLALYRSAGSAPPIDTQPAPEACPPDEAQRGSAASAQHLALMLDGQFREVLPEWLAAMNKARRRVPEECLPALLDHGFVEPGLRNMITSVLGRRGEWLAAQNPDWFYATCRDEREVWETGSREERLLLLENVRTADPAKARELVTTTWPQESAKDRIAFLEKFAIGLNAGDEPFLNDALHDRSVEVRRVGRTLLAGLPSSDFSRRLQELVKPVMSFKRSLIGKARLEVALPNDDPIAWLKEHNIEVGNPPQNTTRSFGPKAWYLKEVISLVPVTHWGKLWAKSPLAIIKAADESEWHESFILGFVTAVQRDRDPDWIEALVAFTASDEKQTPLLELVRYLPASRLEALSLRALESQANGLSDGHPAFHLLLAHRSAWSDQLSRAVVSSLKTRIAKCHDNVADWQTKSALKRFARYVSPALYDELASGWPTDSESWSNWSRNVDAFQSLLAFRRDMHRAISEGEERS
ncbi:MAG: DUF5691 domain-containing protein [Acidobacteria bacterium]|nr:DUF5691 domain-containing protein [Acidobacteriota bacterium]MCA1627278.1 DUF5691 domain-containing protein [Acidobacteriota bacterium]